MNMTVKGQGRNNDGCPSHCEARIYDTEDALYMQIADRFGLVYDNLDQSDSLCIRRSAKIIHVTNFRNKVKEKTLVTVKACGDYHSFQ